jgi:Fe-S-cluster containining protein
MKKNSSHWYEQGLNFQCTECGKCCTGAPGYVWVNEEEMEAMATFLNISLSEFIKKYTRRIGNRTSLLESKKNFDCIFLKDRKCTVYGARPTQCRTYPWWPQNLSSSQAWETTARECEGIQSEAPLVSEEVIEEQLLIQLKRNHRTSFEN